MNVPQTIQVYGQAQIYGEGGAQRQTSISLGRPATHNNMVVKKTNNGIILQQIETSSSGQEPLSADSGKDLVN